MTSPFLSKRNPVCPPELLARAARSGPARVAIARAGAPLPMQAAFEATAAALMIPVFIGERAAIEHEAAALDWDISNFELIETVGEAAAGAAAAALCGDGGADVLMKGQLHTDVFMKAALDRNAGLRTGRRFVHIFHISHPDGGRPIVLSDAAINVRPDIETRRGAILSVVAVLNALGNDRPKIALLSATELPLPSVPSALEARALADWARVNVPGAHVSGPLALDLILSPEAARIKGLTGDPVAGHADGIIVPDVVSGNVLFKSLVYLTGACAAGVVLGGRVPLLVTSRADPPAARLASVALAAIIAGNADKGQ
ncbi:MAG: phosphate acyltransferase [Halocynthiibacter sp.]